MYLCRSMKMRSNLTVFVGLLVIVIFSACKGEFEKIRTSGDPALVLEKANAYFQEEEYQKAQTLYELIAGSYRGKAEAEDILFNYAYTFYHTRQFVMASYWFKNFAQTYGASSKRQDAEFMAAYSNYRMSPSFRLDQTYTLKAIDEFQQFINTYPNNPRVGECNDLIEEMRAKLERKAFEEGQLYFDIRQYQSAVQSYENLLKDFPETERADEVRYMIIKSSFLMAENSFVDKQEERYRETFNLGEEFITRYPESEYAKEVSSILNSSQKKLNQLDNVGYQEQSARAGS